MALKATIFKADLQIADLDRAYFGNHSLTIARHPSETDERMMVRLLGFALFASDQLQFGRGLSSEGEADLWAPDAGGDIEQWISVGLPDEKWVRKACQRARQVALLTYGGRGAEIWQQQTLPTLANFRNLQVMNIPPAQSQLLANMARRTMRLECTIQEGTVWLGDAEHQVTLNPEMLKAAQGR